MRKLLRRLGDHPNPMFPRLDASRRARRGATLAALLVELAFGLAQLAGADGVARALLAVLAVLSVVLLVAYQEHVFVREVAWLDRLAAPGEPSSRRAFATRISATSYRVLRDLLLTGGLLAVVAGWGRPIALPEDGWLGAWWLAYVLATQVSCAVTAWIAELGGEHLDEAEAAFASFVVEAVEAEAACSPDAGSTR